jgi:hypothetical protein
MTTNNFPGIGYKTQGYDFNYFNKIAVTATTFGGTSSSGDQPDAIIKFSTQSVMLLNEGSGSTNIVEVSFNGTTVHAELDPTQATKGLTFDNRVVSMIWLRLKAGSSGSVNVSIYAWSTR